MIAQKRLVRLAEEEVTQLDFSITDYGSNTERGSDKNRASVIQSVGGHAAK